MPDRVDVMIYLKGQSRSFQCDCKCNVFHKPDPANPRLYECNACGARYAGATELEQPTRKPVDFGLIGGARTLLGKRVRVTCNKRWQDGPDSIVEGILLSIGEGGDFVILGDDLFLMYCWPMLDIEAAPIDD